MKKIEAIIRLSQFDKVKKALAKIDVNFFTLKEVKGYGLEKGKKVVYRGSSYGPDYIARLQLEIITTDEKENSIVQTILDSGRTGEIGDGKIIVYDIEQVIRIRSGETAAEAL